MLKTKVLVVSVVVALALSSFGIVLADSHEDAPPEGEETTEEGYTHPVAELLAEYFGSVSEEDQAAAGEALTTEGGLTVVEVVDNGDGTYDVLYSDGSSETITDPDLAATYMGALDTLLQAETGVDTLYEEIEAYHDGGLGYGVIVKFLAMSEGGEVSMEELVAAFESGTGLGQLFKEYGKPDILGIGHVKQALGEAGPPEHSNAGGNGGENGPPDHANNGGGNGGENGPPDHANNDKDKDKDGDD